MPVYDYFCNVCQKTFEVRHSYKDKVTNCRMCKAYDSVSKVLNNPISVRKTKDNLKKNIVPGTEVKEHRRNAKEELRIEKQKLKKRTK